MPIVSLGGSPLDEQKRAVTVGKIRLGHMVARPGKRPAPEALGTFRLTSPAEHQIRAAAAVYGGDPRQITDGRLSGQWEVYTPRDTLPVIVPTADSVSQWMEMWSAAGCLRRCTGEQMQLRGRTGPCLCPKEPGRREELAARGEACQPHTRVSLVLPDLPGLHVWVVESTGINAALEMAQTATTLGMATERGQFLRAQIRVTRRETSVPQQNGPPKVSKFVVPVLEVLDSLRELAAGPRGGQLQLPPPPSAMKALGGGPTTPAPVPAQPVVQEQPAYAVDDDIVDAEIIGTPAVGIPVVTPGREFTAPSQVGLAAMQATSVDRINELLAIAHQAHWLSEPLENPNDPGGQWIPLRQLLSDRVRALATA